MALTKEQRDLRRGFVGASDVAALLGLDPFGRTAMDVWFEKTGRLPDSDNSNEVMGIGDMIEPALVDWWASANDAQVQKSVRVVHPGGVLAVNYDALVIGRPECVEAKTTGIMGPAPDKDVWGESGSDEVPQHFIVQCQAQLAADEALVTANLVALIGGMGRRSYIIPRDKEVVDIIIETVHDFWSKNVKTDTPPDAAPSPTTWKRINRRTDKIAKISREDVVRYINAKKAAKEAGLAVEDAEAALHKALGDCECGEYELGGGKKATISYPLQKRASYTVKETEYRQIRPTWNHIKL